MVSRAKAQMIVYNCLNEIVLNLDDTDQILEKYKKELGPVRIRKLKQQIDGVTEW